MTRGRLAPSPTGAQHLGNARTHLITYWAVAALGGELVLRIDDLDSPRVKAWAIDQAVEDIRWLGIRWEGAPLIQSQHARHYRQALDRITAGDHDWAYPCRCSRKDIAEALSAPHESRFRGEGPVYPGTCRGWTSGDPLPDSEYCWRLRASDRTLAFDDLVLGRQTCNPAVELGDFPITVKTGQPSYQLAVVVDDHQQEVDLVIRGNDLVASTFRQLDVSERLGLGAPTYAHVPLVVGTDGRRLAKRHGDTRLSYYRERGISAETIVGWAAHSLGLIDRCEPCKADELIREFTWSKITDDPTRIDPPSLFDR